MTWLARTWAICMSYHCPEEILRNRALAAGWYLRPEGGWLCPYHRPEVPPAGLDGPSLAAGERT